MTPEQEAFNKIWDWFIVQGKPAGLEPNTDGACKLRTSDGKCCAVGLLIPDDEYEVSLESCAVDPETLIFRVPALNGLGALFLVDIQAAHDAAAYKVVDFHKRITERLTDIARRSGFTIPTTQATA